MDIVNLGFTGLMTIGFVNVLSWFLPNLKSEYKFGLSVVFAFLLSFVPVELGNVIANKLVEALKIAGASSGAYKIAQKMGK